MENVLMEMFAGRPYDMSDPYLARIRTKAHKLCKDYNDTYEDETEKRALIFFRMQEITSIFKDRFSLIMESTLRSVTTAMRILILRYWTAIM